MRLTQFTDYALRILMLLAADPNKRITIQHVAEVHSISRNHLMKVANRLARAGIVRPSRGRNGGLALALPPEQLMIGDIIQAVEPDFALVACMGGDFCVLSGSCRLTGVLEGALRAFIVAANRYSLADIASPAPVTAVFI